MSDGTTVGFIIFGLGVIWFQWATIRRMNRLEERISRVEPPELTEAELEAIANYKPPRDLDTLAAKAGWFPYKGKRWQGEE